MDIAHLGISIDASGVERASQSLDQFAVSAGKAEIAADKLVKGALRAEAALMRIGKAAGSAKGALKGLALDSGGIEVPTVKATAVAAPVSSARSAMASVGAETGGASSAGDAAAKSADLLQHVASVRELGKAWTDTGQKTGIAADKVKEMALQLKDVAVALMSGEDPLKVFMDHGLEIAGLAMESGAGLGEWVAALGLANPVVLGVAAALAALAAVAALVNVQMAERKEIAHYQGQISALADGSQYTAEGLAEVAHALDLQGVSADEARSEIQAFMQDGIRPERMKEFGAAAMELAQITGEDVVNAAKSVSEAFTGTYDDVAKLDDRLHFLSDTERHHIKVLYDSGKASEARNEAFNDFSQRYGKAYNDTLTDADRLTQNLAGAWDNMVHTLANTDLIKGATDIIGGLTKSLADWLLQFVAVKSMTDAQLMQRSKQLSQEYFNEQFAASKANAARDDARAKGVTGRSLGELEMRAQIAQAFAERTRLKLETVNVQITPPVGDTTSHARTGTGTGTGTGGRSGYHPAPVRQEAAVPEFGFERLPYQARDAYMRQTRVSLDDLKNGGGITPVKTDTLGPSPDRNVVENLKKIPEVVYPVRDAFIALGKTVSENLSKAIVSGEDFGKSMASAFQSMEQAWLKHKISDIFAKLGDWANKKAIESGGSGSWGSDVWSGVSDFFSGGTQKNAKGGVYDSPSLSSYANQVHDSPRLFSFAKGTGQFGEAGPEAIMPLQRGRDGSLGVRVQQSPQATAPVIHAPLIQVNAGSDVVSNDWVAALNKALKDVHDRAVRGGAAEAMKQFPTAQQRLFLDGRTW